MIKTSPEVFLEGVHSVVGWDMDGFLFATNWVEKKLEKRLPGFIPRVQVFFQPSKGLLVPQRHLVAQMFLARRSLSNEGIQALIHAHEESKTVLADSNIVVKNAVYTDRPEMARKLTLDQLASGVQRFRQGLGIDDLIDGYFDNPFGSDPRQVKSKAAQMLENLGVRLHLVEDKKDTALRVKKTAPSTWVYLLQNSFGNEEFCYQNELVPVYSAGDFVQKAFDNIRMSQPNP